MNAAPAGRIAFLASFCAFQALIAYWLIADGAVVPSLPQAEHLLEQQEYHAALPHLNLLADAGSPKANWLLGELYVGGTGVRRDVKRGIAYLEKAAEGGMLPAQFLLSRLYSNGEGVRKDVVRAHMWLSLAALQDGDGSVLLRLMESGMTPEQIEQAWALAEQRAPGARAKLRNR